MVSELELCPPLAGAIRMRHQVHESRSPLRRTKLLPRALFRDFLHVREQMRDRIGARRAFRLRSSAATESVSSGN